MLGGGEGFSVPFLRNDTLNPPPTLKMLTRSRLHGLRNRWAVTKSFSNHKNFFKTTLSLAKLSSPERIRTQKHIPNQDHMVTYASNLTVRWWGSESVKWTSIHEAQAGHSQERSALSGQ